MADPEIDPADEPDETSDALRESIAALSGLVAGSMGQSALLREVASFATRAIPGADGAGITVLSVEGDRSRVEALAASAPFVAEVDQVQYAGIDQGPCVTAVDERRTVRCGALGSEARWARFGARAARLGVHSVLSLPLLLPDRVVGAISVYARARDAFDDRAAGLGELFAAPAAVAVHNARVLARAHTVADQLRVALAARPVVDQAVGLLLGRSGLDEAQALAWLRGVARTEGVPVAEVARRTVDEAVARARTAT